MADSFSAPSLVEVSRGCITVTSALGWCPLLFGDRGGSGGQPLLPDLQACPTRWSELQEHPGVLVKTGNYSTEAALRQKSVFPKSLSSPRAAWAPGAALWSILQAPAGGGWCGGVLGGVLGWWLACRGAGRLPPALGHRPRDVLPAAAAGSGGSTRGFMGQNAPCPQSRSTRAKQAAD